MMMVMSVLLRLASRRALLSPSGRLFFLPIAALLAASLLVGCMGGSEEREESFDLGSSPTVVVSNENGDIEVRAGSSALVEIQTTFKNPSLVEYRVRQVADDRIEVEARGRRNSILDHVLFWRSSAAAVVILVPAMATIELQASNGKIAVEGLKRGGSLRTSNGSITIDDVEGYYEARTSNGPVTVTSLEGEANIQTSNGAVVLTDVYGRFDVGTSNGSITLTGRLTGSNRLTTSNGDVEVNFDGQTNLAVNASTSNGRITSKLPIRADDESTGRLIGKMGNGETELLISTSNGSITLQ
jgi:hypothetical protein